MNTTAFHRLTRHPVLWLLALLLSATATVSHAVPINETYTYDALNRLTTAGASSYQYDAAGNILQMTSPGTPDLFATPTTATVGYTASSSTQISLTTNVSWTATSNQPWLTVAPGSGTTSATLTATATTANPTVNTRSGTITITGSGLTSTVTITQDGMPPAGTLTVTPTNSTVSSTAAAGLSFSVTSTSAWTATSSQPWLTLTNSNGPGNGTITANTTAAVRSATVNLTSGTLTATYTLNQQAPNTDDHGGSIATATIIPTTASSATGIITIGDEDFFRITIPGPGILITWTASSIDTYGYIYDAAGTELKPDDDSDLGFNFRVSAAVVAGNYYVRVRGYNAASTTGPYTIITRFIPSTAPIQISYLEKSGPDVKLGFPSVSGTTYYIQGSTNLTTWTQLATVTGDGAEPIPVLVGEGSSTRKYFRVSTTPPPPAGFALIPAGAFQMGNSTNFSEGYANEVVHTTNVSAFYMQTNLVTKEQWDGGYAYASANGYAFDYAGAGKAANHPVQTVSWYDVVKWCNARSQQDGLQPCYEDTGAIYKTGQISTVTCDFTKNGYRLPTESEWEKAARGGLIGKRFAWGDTIAHSQANYYSSSANSYDISPTRGFHPTYGIVSAPYTSPGGSFEPNAIGLYDMAGNVWQWCWDWHGTYPSGISYDPIGSSSGSHRVLRGGSWTNDAYWARVANRPGDIPTNASNAYGFRLARGRL